jgi:hypothetical protein
MLKSAYFIKTQLRRFLRFRLVISKVLSRILQVSPSWTILPALLVACILFLPQNQKAGSHPGQYQRASGADPFKAIAFYTIRLIEPKNALDLSINWMNQLRPSRASATN